MEKIKIEIEKENEYYEVENLVREAFWNVYKPGCSEHFVLHKLRECENYVKNLGYVLKLNEKIIGQVAFCRAELNLKGKIIPILTMGPICIDPKFKGKGYGKEIVNFALKKAQDLGLGAVCIEGDFGFYSKCGFDFARNFGLKYHGLPDGVDDSFFLCKELIAGYLKDVRNGEYSTPSVYFVNDEDVENFDKSFPPKEKKVLTGQIFN